MNAAKFILALTLLAGVAAISFLTPTPSFAQSQPIMGRIRRAAAIPSANRIAAVRRRDRNRVAGRLHFAID
jgi:hypothetical protein